MGLFGGSKTKKNSGDSKSKSASADKKTKSSAGSKAKKPKEMVSSVIDESVLEQVLEEMKANTQFISSYEDEPAYVGMLLKTDDIGGLSLKTNKDEAKGSIVECIKNGRIKVYASEELLNNEQFVIIPDAMTLDAMSEFSILDIEYELVKVTEDGEVHPTGIVAGIDQMIEIVNDESLTIDSVIGDDDEAEEAVPDDYAEEVDTSQAEELPEDENDTPFNDSIETSDYEEPSVLDEGVPDDEELDQYEDGQSDESYSEAADEQPQEEDASPQIDYTRDEFDEAITRRFYSDDLGLEVTTEAFDQQFLHNNLFVPFAENRPDGWLNNYLNDMSRQYNQELYQLHQQNLAELRDEFFTMVSLGAQQIVADCDYSTEATVFGQQASYAEQAKHDADMHCDDEIAKRKDAINEEWERKLNEVGEAAAAQARQQYKDRYTRQHEDDLFRVQSSVMDEIEQGYNAEMRKIHDERKALAQKKMDAFIHEALQQAALHRKDMLAVENTRYHEMQAELQKFMDENRKDEIARSEVLARELAQSKKVDEVLAESTQKLNNLAADYDAKRLALLQEIDVTEKRHKSELATQKASHESAMVDLQERNRSLQSRVDQLVSDISNLDDRKSREVEKQIAELKAENQAWSAKCDNIMEMHKHGNVIGIFLAAVAVIAAIAIGFIAGEYININKTAQVANNQILSEFNESMNNIQNSSWNNGTYVNTQDGNNGSN